MWQQLALAGLKSVQDEQNRNNDLASNVITQKYSPWTGARADFSGQGKRNTMSNMIAGYGAGLLQDRQDELFDREKKWFDQQMNKDKVAEYKSDADFYSKLSADPSSAGVSAKGGSSSFAPVASRAPAVERAPSIDVTGNMEQRPVVDMNSLASQMVDKDPTPLMLQGHVPYVPAQNPWSILSKGHLYAGQNDPAPTMKQIYEMKRKSYGN